MIPTHARTHARTRVCLVRTIAASSGATPRLAVGPEWARCLSRPLIRVSILAAPTL
jgi:hypothetical protein